MRVIIPGSVKSRVSVRKRFQTGMDDSLQVNHTGCILVKRMRKKLRKEAHIGCFVRCSRRFIENLCFFRLKSARARGIFRLPINRAAIFAGGAQPEVFLAEPWELF
jgi:hypothetical protein